MSSIYFKYENIAACLKIVEENNMKRKILLGRDIKKKRKPLKTIPAVQIKKSKKKKTL